MRCTVFSGANEAADDLMPRLGLQSRFPPPSRYRRPSGAVLLALTLILTLTATSGLLAYLQQLSITRQQQAVHHTVRTLAAAKQVLIGYAVTYPDHFPYDSPKHGPGFLPCPDTNNDGSPNPPCGKKDFGLHPTGRLPWRYLGLDDLRDSAGERLWYALSLNFRNNPKISSLNSDTPGQLCVDTNHDNDCNDSVDASDLVAILFAPGFALESQDRASDVNDLTHYLEGDNVSRADGRYQRASSTAVDAAEHFNDRLVTLSRGELMAAIERRVLKEAEQALLAYAEDGDGDSAATYLWLAPFDNPSTAAYRGEVGQHFGQIAHHYRLQPPFATDFTLDLSLAGGFAATFEGTVSSAHLTTATIAFNAIDGSACRWHDATSIDCSASARAVVQGANAPPYPATWRERQWQLDGIKFSGSTHYTPASARDVRRRSVSTADPSSAALELLINDTAYYQACSTCGATTAQSGSGAVKVKPDTLGTISVSGLHADLAVPDELPEWFIKNRWHHLIYIATAAAHAPGGSGHCTPPSCLILTDRSGATNHTIAALALIAGPTLALQSRPSNQLSDYYEDANQDGDAIFDASLPRSAAFNDNIIVIQP